MRAFFAHVSRMLVMFVAISCAFLRTFVIISNYLRQGFVCTCLQSLVMFIDVSRAFCERTLGCTFLEACIVISEYITIANFLCKGFLCTFLRRLGMFAGVLRVLFQGCLKCLMTYCARFWGGFPSGFFLRRLVMFAEVLRTVFHGCL